MPETPIIGSVVINTTDHDTLVAFWSALLGVEVAHSIPPFFTWLKPQREGGISVAIQAVPDPTPGRRRLHLDMGVSDVDAAVARVLELGGSHVEDHEIEGFAWKVMADPDGNEFCIAPGE
jgi:predicted enzyme related to lactoylglutathione lyase